MPIYHSVTELIGRTPLLELCNYERNHDLKAVLLAKLECMNPAGSAKDRVAANMIAGRRRRAVWLPAAPSSNLPPATPVSVWLPRLRQRATV